MPNFCVWYRNNPEPLAFATAYRPSEMQIVEQILAHEKIAIPPGATPPSVTALIAAHNLAPVSYTEDESEINVIS